MPLGSMLAQELPFLRRYARAATGSQHLGDAAVQEVLQALLEAPEEFDREAPVRIELYRIFHRLWKPADGVAAGRRPTALLDPEERYALLLTAVEGFTPAETATILDTDEFTVQVAVELARETISRNLNARVMIIEDEPMIAMHIRQVAEESGHTVCGVARTHAEAVKLAAEVMPDIVLADIKLADGSSGVEAVQEILGMTDIPVVFVTSYPERLLTGERPEPTYLITKPFVEATLMATVGQALMYYREGEQLQQPVGA